MAQSLEHAASKGTANTALGIGIGALGLELLRGGCGGLFGNGLFGGKDGCGCGCGHGYGHGYDNHGYGYGYGHGCGNYGGPGYGYGYDGYGYCYGRECPTAYEVLMKEQCDALNLTCMNYDTRIADMQDRFCDRQYTDAGFFGLEKQILTQRFEDYKDNECKFNEQEKEICNLKTHIAVMEATRPYQDKIIQMEIAGVKKDCHCDLMWHTRNMITGEVVLPTTPEVTGLPSQSTCCRYINGGTV